MTMTRVRFRRSIASAEWGYMAGQVVEVGTRWMKSEIPLDAVAAWLQANILEPVEAPIETATPPAVRTAAARPRRTKRAGGDSTR